MCGCGSCASYNDNNFKNVAGVFKTVFTEKQPDL